MAATRQVIRNFEKFVKPWSWVVVGVDRDGLSSSGGREAVVALSRTDTKVLTLPSVKKKFISLDEE